MKKEELTNIKIDGPKATGIKPDRISYIVEEVMYWRKANQIHNWFIENCADGDGDKTKMYVSHEQLQELLDTCKKVLEASKLVKGKIANGQRSTPNGWEDILEDGEYIEDPSVAQELLPTQSGFFFGSTNYDQYYIQDVKDTIECLEKLLVEDGSSWADFEYTASW